MTFKSIKDIVENIPILKDTSINALKKTNPLLIANIKVDDNFITVHYTKVQSMTFSSELVVCSILGRDNEELYFSTYTSPIGNLPLNLFSVPLNKIISYKARQVYTNF